MARLARTIAVGFPHHITHRGNRRCDIFLDDADRAHYLELLADYAAKAQLEIWGYCLMSNHVHLIAVPLRADALARGVGLTHRRYAAWLNRRERYSGHLWANRYFSTPLDESRHWMAIRYVERNPVRAGLVRHAEQCRWSSARAHALREPDGLLAASRPYPGPVGDWREWLRAPDGSEDTEQVERLRRCTQTGRPCGSEGFVGMLEGLLGRVLHPGQRGRKPKSADREEAGQMSLFEE